MVVFAILCFVQQFLEQDNIISASSTGEVFVYKFDQRQQVQLACHRLLMMMMMMMMTWIKDDNSVIDDSDTHDTGVQVV